jgi:hypothetical protein
MRAGCHFCLGDKIQLPHTIIANPIQQINFAAEQQKSNKSGDKIRLSPLQE